jgi:hypothetical protein
MNMSKRFPGGPDDKRVVPPVVNETKALPYGHKKAQGQGIRAAASIATVKRRLKKPVKRTRREIEWALGIVGIGEGPEDLSGRAREYLYGDK